MERITTNTATIICCDKEQNLTAILECGEEVLIPSDEIHKDKTSYDLSRHIGREMEIVDTHRRSADGRRIFSHKIVEENDFEWLRHNFETGKRNTYWAHYRGLTNNGTLAFYKIGDTTVNGAISLKDFALNHFTSYNDFVMPASIQVVITEISNGRIRLSSIPGFIGFDETVDMLRLHPGSSPIGKATHRMPNSLTTMVMLTPNVATLIDGDYEGADVKVLVTSIIHDKRKIKSHLDSVLAMPGNRKIDLNQYITKKPLPAFLLLDDYKSEHGYFKRRGTASTADAAAPIAQGSCSETTKSNKNPLSYFDSFLRSLAG